MKPIPDEVLRESIELCGECARESVYARALLELRGAVRGVLRGECCWCDVVAHDAARALLPEGGK